MNYIDYIINIKFHKIINYYEDKFYDFNINTKFTFPLIHLRVVTLNT